MNHLELLLRNVGRVTSRVGAFFPGTHVMFRGQDLHAHLGDMEWLDLFVFGITGRRHTAQQLRMLNAMWSYTSFPDVRLWNNRVAGLAGSARSTPALGMSAALAVSESVIYGATPCVRAIDFLRQAQRRVRQGEALDRIVDAELKARRIYGYGRPIILVDERLPWLVKLAEELGLDQGEHFRLAFEVEQLLVARDSRLKMNYASLVAALAADMGFSPREFHHYQIPMLLAGMHPCYIEAEQQPEGSLFPMRCEDIAYEGRARRPWQAEGSM
jgi:hypothetical protein